ncbi:uncharacterized protein LOC141900440 [Tubulanus polymorphus]|uniref:uncharacterized protein LOC141900440 n=1 Tax=Tubulanus polymorphus TaxID=672921 RepID=UPI003DA58725
MEVEEVNSENANEPYIEIEEIVVSEVIPVTTTTAVDSVVQECMETVQHEEVITTSEDVPATILTTAVDSLSINPNPDVPIMKQKSKVNKKNRKHCIWQHKRRKRNNKVVPKIKIKPVQLPDGKSSTTSASNSSSIILRRKSSPSNPPFKTRNQTLQELLSNVPGFSFKPRVRSRRKLSTAAQIAQTKQGCIDLETPDSILVNTNLKALLNKHTFGLLPPAYHYRLIQLLPECDRIICADGSLRFSGTGLNNEFFTKACVEWRERLADGEFTPENQLKINQEEEREQAKIDPWKVKHFEPVWGERCLVEPSLPLVKSPPPAVVSTPVLSRKTTPPIATSTPLKMRPPMRKAKLVSTMLKQRSIAQNLAVTAVSTSSSSSPSLSSSVTSVTSSVDESQSSLIDIPNVSSSTNLTSSVAVPTVVSLLTGTAQTSPCKVPKLSNELLIQSLKRPAASTNLFNETAAPKRIKTIVTPAIKTVSTVQPAVPQPSQPSANVIKVTSESVQNTTGSANVNKYLSPNSFLKTIQTASKGQTRTLAQIKAQNKAKLQARASCENNALTSARRVPNIIQNQSAKSKSASSPPSKSVPGGVNLQRSLQICQSAFEKSKSLSTTNNQQGLVSILSQSSNTPASGTTASARVSQILALAAAETKAAEAAKTPVTGAVKVTAAANIKPISQSVPTSPTPAFKISPRSPQTVNVNKIIVSTTSSMPVQRIQNIIRETQAKSVNNVSPASTTVLPTLTRLPSLVTSEGVAVVQSSTTKTMPTLVRTASSPSIVQMTNVVTNVPVSVSSRSASQSPKLDAKRSSPIFVVPSRPNSTPATVQTAPVMLAVTSSAANASSSIVTGIIPSTQQLIIVTAPVTTSNARTTTVQPVHIQQNKQPSLIGQAQPAHRQSPKLQSNKPILTSIVTGSQPVLKPISVQIPAVTATRKPVVSHQPNKSSGVLSCTIVKNKDGTQTVVYPSKCPPRASSAPPNADENLVKTSRSVVTSKPASVARSASVGGNCSSKLEESCAHLLKILREEPVKTNSTIKIIDRGSPKINILKTVDSSMKPALIKNGTSKNVTIVSSKDGTFLTPTSVTNASAGVLPQSIQIGGMTIPVTLRQTNNVVSNPSVIPIFNSNVQINSSGLTVAPLQNSNMISSNNSISDNNQGGNCACSLKAMVMCKKCGAFCHHDCIGPSKLCVTCLITT